MDNFGRRQRIATLSLMLVSLVMAQLPVAGQTRRGSARRQGALPSKPQQKPTGAPAIAQGKPVTLIESPKSRALGEAFESGKLPEPLRMPPGSIDEQAAALAKAVSLGDQNSTAAIYAAALAAGYGVRDADGSVLQTTERGQGLILDAGEIATMAKLYGEGYGVGLERLGEAFTRNVPEFKNLPLANVLLEGIRANASSDHPALRFWARFIVELGRQSATPYDLLGTLDARKVRLDAVQMSLILSRLTGDLIVLERRQQQGRFKPPLLEHTYDRPTDYLDGITSVKRAHAVSRSSRMNLGSALMPKAQQLPCSLGDIESVILDYNAIATTTGFGLLAGHLGRQVSVIDKYGKGVSLANLVLAVIKFVASYALLETEITLNDQMLTRTKDTHAGQQRTLSAKLRMDTGKWQTLNCVRPALNAAGLDFNLPSDGALSDVQVVWILVQGGDTRGVLSTLSQSDAMRILRAAAESFLSGNPAARIENTDIGRSGHGNAIVSLKNLDGTNSSMAKQSTDNNGVSRVDVVGAPQHKDLSLEKLNEKYAVAGVRVDIQLKPMKITNATDLASTLGDIGGNVLSFLTGDFAGGAVGTVAETLYRSNWYRSEPFYFLVKDWAPCDGAWTGTISVSAKFEETKENPSPGYISKTEAVKKEYEVKYNLAGIKDTSENFKNGYFADALATIEDSSTQVEKRNNGGFCDTGRRDHRGSRITENVRGVLTVTNRTARIGAGTTRTTVYIASRGAEGYNILINAPPQPVKGVRQYDHRHEFPQCPLWERVNSSNEERPETFYLPQIEFLATFDPKHPGVLSGSKTVRDSSGRPVTYTWDLQHCK